MSPLPIEGLIHKGLPPQLKTGFNFLVFNTAWTFIVGELTGNYSQVDRVWSFLPTIYTMIYTFYPLLDSAPLALKQQGVQPRAVLMSALQVSMLSTFGHPPPGVPNLFAPSPQSSQLLWTTRLTYHATRRGFFDFTSEDYRWLVFRDFVHKAPVLRSAPRLVLGVFNLLFIAIAQNVLLAMLGLPAYSAAASTEPLHWGDALLAGLIVSTLALEFVSDNQQYAYQNFKRTGQLDLENEWPGSKIKFTQADKERGFITRGLWAWSRHPNCACEQSVWLFTSLFPLLTNAHLASNIIDMLVILTPALSLCALFIASTNLTESISSGKYPAYKQYQKRVGMFWPTGTGLKMLWLSVWGGKAEAESAVWGQELRKKEE